MSEEVVYDAAVLIAADRNDRRAWAEHRFLLQEGVVPGRREVSSDSASRELRLRRSLEAVLAQLALMAFTPP